MPPADASETPDLPAKPLFSTLPGKIYALLGLLLVGVIGYFYCTAFDSESLGFTHDDGVYAVAGKSLAMGKGFKLLHVVGEPGEIKYPFLYPLILSVVWRVMPQFPQNLPALNYVTIAFTLAGCWLTFAYLKQCQKFPGWLALMITAIIPANFFFIYFFSSIMSEGPYLFFTMLALWVFYQASQREKPLTLNTVLLLVLLSAAAFLTRVLGVSLMAAIGTWLLLNRQWKNAVVYGLGSFLLGVLPWILWVKFNTPVVNDYNYPLVNAYSNYGLEFFHNLVGSNYVKGIAADFFSLITKLMEVMFPLISNLPKIYPQLKHHPDFMQAWGLGALGLSYLLFGYFVLQMVSTTLALRENGRFQRQKLTVPGLYLFYYIAIITLWNYEDQMARFLTPVLPLLWLYFFKPLIHLLPDFGRKLPQPRWKMMFATFATLMACVLSLWLASSSYRTIQVSRTQHWVDSGKYRWLWGEYKQVFKWMNANLPQNAKLGAASDVVFYLYTNRPTFYVFYASLRRANGKFLPESIPLLMKSLDHYHIDYLIAEPHMQFRTVRFPVNLVAKQLIEQYPERFQHIYSSPRTAIRIFKILPPHAAKNIRSASSQPKT